MRKHNWEMISIIENKAFEHLSIMLKNQGDYEIEFASWAITSPPQSPLCPTLPRTSNVLMWYDVINGYWVMFCGSFWKWGKKDTLPKIGENIPNRGWKQYGFSDNK
jgi:hypothetical protein